MIRAHHILVSLCVMLVAFALSVSPALGAEGGENCPNEQLRAEQHFGASLPDCRAYEMVSPLEKDDNGVSIVDSRAAVSGEAFAYISPGSFAGPKSALLEGRYISRREAGGWSTQNISPPHTDHVPALLVFPAFSQSLFTPDLSSGVLESRYTPLVAGQAEGYVNLYAADTKAGSYRAVTTAPEAEYAPFEEGGYNEVPQPEGASTDLSRVVFQQGVSLCCGASPRRGHIYEWEDGKLSLVDVAPEGAKFEAEANVGPPPDFEQPAYYGNPWHAVSGDGSRVFFTGAEGKEALNFGQLYVRENPTSAVDGCLVAGGACTVEVSASQRTDCNVQRKAKEPGFVCTGALEPDPNDHRQVEPGLIGLLPAFYRDASVDGSRVFFTSRAELTNDADTGPDDNAANLYEYDLSTGLLSDLTPVTMAEEAEDPTGAAVLGLVTASEDGSYVYFVANGVLAEGARAGNCMRDEREKPVMGGRTCSLYVVHRGAGGWEAPRFVATLAGGNNGFAREHERGNGDEADWVGYEEDNTDFGPGYHTVRVSGDGTILAFESEMPLTPSFDNEQEPGVGQQPEPLQCGESGKCREVYLYDAVTGKLICVSCDPSGARPVGSAELGGHEAGQGVTTPEPFYLPRNLSESGGRLFFQTPDALVPHDSNGKLNVYEWERAASPVELEKGENSCTPSSPGLHVIDEGCVVPVSDVAGAFESRFMDASPSGNDVFIDTQDQLVPSDTDTRADAYDVRVGGGFPVVTPPPVCTNGDSCKPPVSAQPEVFGVPASATFSGPGDPTSSSPLPAETITKPSKKTVQCKEPKKLTRGKCLKPVKRAKRVRKARRAGHDRRAYR